MTSNTTLTQEVASALLALQAACLQPGPSKDASSTSAIEALQNLQAAVDAASSKVRAMQMHVVLQTSLLLQRGKLLAYS